MIFEIEKVKFKIEGIKFEIEKIKPKIEAFDDFNNDIFSIIIIKLKREKE